MKKMRSCFMIMVLSSLTIHTMAQTIPSALSEQQVNEWYEKKEWLEGLPLQPHETVNKTTFARQYQLNKTYWNKAFAFIKDNDLQTLAAGRYAIDGDNVYAMITENPTKDLDSTKWESHHNYIDLHNVIKGEEQIGVAAITTLTVTMPYDASKDLINYSGEGNFYKAEPGTFFLFFPADGHRPNITTNGNKPDKKIVIKIRYSE